MPLYLPKEGRKKGRRKKKRERNQTSSSWFQMDFCSKRQLEGSIPFPFLTGTPWLSLLSPWFLRARTETQRDSAFSQVIHSTSPSLRCPKGLYHQKGEALPQSGIQRISIYALHYLRGNSPPCLEFHIGLQVRCEALAVSWASMNSH